VDERPRWSKQTVHARLGLTVETLLAGGRLDESDLPSPWDAWWISHRLARPAPALGMDPARSPGACPDCRRAAAELSASRPPRHTDGLPIPPPCGCLHTWCTWMRAPAPFHRWPIPRLALALAKPDAPREPITRYLARHYRILHRRTVHLSSVDVRRLYPEAYGARFVAERDAYLTSGPSQALVLLDASASVQAGTVKAAVRSRLQAGRLRNHLHMADNPAETFADLLHLVGIRDLTDLYETYEADLAPARLAHYRDVLERGAPGPARLGSRTARPPPQP